MKLYINYLEYLKKLRYLSLFYNAFPYIKTEKNLFIYFFIRILNYRTIFCIIIFKYDLE